jgi:ACT domain-containing protein
MLKYPMGTVLLAMTHQQMMSSAMMHIQNGQEDHRESPDWFREVSECF